jgi:aerobic-type carbon monoxide dehydrogenase small subunit (CoxS/CutS family)
MSVPIRLVVNGRERRLEVKANELLLNVLRERLQLTGTKYGCGLGECSACTVLLDGRPILSCQTLAVSVAGRRITTIEGVAGSRGPAPAPAPASGAASSLHPLQEAFLEEGAVQCGYCTPAMILTAKALLDRNPEPSTDDIRQALRGNLCRCTGYVSIIKAVKSAARKMRELGSCSEG